MSRRGITAILDWLGSRRRLEAADWRLAVGEAQVRVLAEPDPAAPYSLEFPSFVEPGEYVLLAAGGVVPCDGHVVCGDSIVQDGPACEGPPEARPATPVEGSELLAGGRVLSGWIVLEVTRAARDSRLAHRLREGSRG